MRVYLSTWTFKRQIARGDIRLLDFPQWTVDNGFAGIEIMDRQLLRYPGRNLYLLGERARDANCGLVLDASTDLTLSEPRQWQEQIQYVISLLELSKDIGVEKLRILLGGQSVSFQKLYRKSNKTSPERGWGSAFQSWLVNRVTVRLGNELRKLRSGKMRHLAAKTERAVLALKQIMTRAEEQQIPVVIENHWGISSCPETILQIIAEVDSPLLGICPDFDNFPTRINPYEGLQVLMSKAMHVHAKSRSFNKVGEERNIDYARCIRIVKSHFDGNITVEYEGHGDVLQGALKTLALIKKHG